MLRRIGLVFVFFGVMSAAYAIEPIEKTPEECDIPCMGKCGFVGGDRATCGYICGC